MSTTPCRSGAFDPEKRSLPRSPVEFPRVRNLRTGLFHDECHSDDDDEGNIEDAARHGDSARALASDGVGVDAEGGGGASGGGGADRGGSDGADGGAAEGDVSDSRRSTAEILARKPKSGARPRSLPGTAEYDALPKGPWTTLAGATTAFETIGRLSGHRFSKSSGLNPAIKTRGAQQVIVCQYNTCPRVSVSTGVRQRAMLPLDEATRCPFTVMLEESQEGWIIAYAVAEHSDHKRQEPRVLSEAERRSTHNQHNSKIPDELLNLITPDMMLFRPSISDLNRFINEKALALGYQVVWTYNDVANFFAASGSEREHDSSNLIDELQKRLEEKSLQYKFRLDEMGRLVEVFFEMVRALPHPAIHAQRLTRAARNVAHADAHA